MAGTGGSVTRNPFVEVSTVAAAHHQLTGAAQTWQRVSTLAALAAPERGGYWVSLHTRDGLPAGGFIACAVYLNGVQVPGSENITGPMAGQAGQIGTSLGLPMALEAGDVLEVYAKPSVLPAWIYSDTTNGVSRFDIVRLGDLP